MANSFQQNNLEKMDWSTVDWIVSNSFVIYYGHRLETDITAEMFEYLMMQKHLFSHFFMKHYNKLEWLWNMKPNGKTFSTAMF